MIIFVLKDIDIVYEIDILEVVVGNWILVSHNVLISRRIHSCHWLELLAKVGLNLI